MKPHCVFFWLIGLSMAAGGFAATRPGEPYFATTHNDWTLSVDPAGKTLVVGHKNLGVLLTNIQLQIQGVQEMQTLNDWVVDHRLADGVVVRTSHPGQTWVFQMTNWSLRISCTAPRAAVRAQIPRSNSKIVARLLDPAGFPVDWTGTDEVASGYGGSITRNPSHLPRRNPECMYFALGAVANGPFHSLFDQDTDIAIDFPDEARFFQSRTTGSLELVLPLAGSVEIKLIPDYFTHTLGVPFYERFQAQTFPRAPMVWCSWTSYYGDVTEAAMVTNADWLAENLKPYGFQYVQLDDGYDRLPEGHQWIDHWDTKKFPHGPQWLAEYIKAKGLHAGLWLVPNAYAGAVTDHPQWYLRDQHGSIVQDYGTPALDSSNPEVLDFLKTLFGTLRKWGFDYFKFDGEHALPQYVPAVDRGQLYDKTTDPIVVYRHRLEVIRSVIGANTFVEGCPAGTPLNGISFFNSYFNGNDLYNNWNGMHPLFSSINANAFLNRMLVYVMPGEGLELGPHITVQQAKRRRSTEVVETARSREEPMSGFGVTSAEARTLVSFVALSGVAYSLAGVMPELPADRLLLLQRTLPTLPIGPIDLFSRGTDITWDTFKHTTADDYIHHYPEIVDLKVNAASGIYDVLALPNWRSEVVTKNVSFTEKLGLPPGTSCVAFDFWNQTLLGVFKDQVSAEIQAHDTRVILLHPLAGHPQLIGNSRHISGSYSVTEVAWDSSSRVLRGSSNTIPGRRYSLFIYVPQTEIPGKILAKGSTGNELPVRRESKGNSLAATFEPSTDQVAWEIHFRSAVQ